MIRPCLFPMAASFLWILPLHPYCQALTTVSVQSPTTRTIRNRNNNNNNNVIIGGSADPWWLDPIIQRQILLLQDQPRRITEAESNGPTALVVQEEQPRKHVAAAVLPQLRRTPLPYSAQYLLHANRGLQAWRVCLLRGRLPVAASLDFPSPNSNINANNNNIIDTAMNDDDESSESSNYYVWPPEPLFTEIGRAMAQLELPRLVLRHNELANAVLSSLLRAAWDFQQQDKRREQQEQQEQRQDVIDKQEDDDDEATLGFDIDGDDEEIQALFRDPYMDTPAEELVVTGFLQEWGGLVQGISALDKLYGANHGLLQFDNNKDDDQTLGFGTNDGVWQHLGWKMLSALQQEELSSMPQLKHLLNQIGRRSTTLKSDAIHRFAPRQKDPDGGLGAQLDAQRHETTTGLTLSNSFSEMLPSEAALLKSYSLALRRLFLAKKVESKLLSYEFAGWYDTESTPRMEKRHLRNTPSAPGGPMIICLDTSWSMSGRREVLSKAVVVASVAAAHRQKRDCQVVAFSSASGVMETGLLSADAAGVQRLLDFLSHSFAGGTDVTGALKHAVQTLGSSDQMAAADLLLVTDGEIPDPPVPQEMMEDFDRLKRRTGMEIHGLLVGKRESIPLSKLCTTVHDFLYDFDVLTSAASRRFASSRLGTIALQGMPFGVPQYARIRPFLVSQRNAPTPPRTRFHGMLAFPRSRQNSVRLFATTTEDDRFILYKRAKSSEKQSGGPKRGHFYDEDDDLWELEDSSVEPLEGYVAANVANTSAGAESSEGFQAKGQLDEEKNAKHSCWKYKNEIKTAVEKVGENLVERDEESRLVVLGLVAKEHVLLLGPPGTAKSEIGRRLSKLCNGPFFQRLLTRFTTPEEIFGPLSLRALENDEYRRCTEGFLPTASVAFLDEIFKANSAILNTLLTILNERQFDNGAGQREDCQIRCVVGASNEMPETDELDALFDRFLLRKEVLPVSDDGIMQILSMLTPGTSSCDERDAGPEAQACESVFSHGLDQIVDELSAGAEQVTMSDDACVLIRDLRTFMAENLDVQVSDRRLVKAARLLKLSACSHGRTRVDPIDCLLLQHIAWRLPEQRAVVRDWLWEHITPGGDSATAAVAQFRLLLNSLRNEAITIVRKTSGDVTGSMGALAPDISIIHDLIEEVSAIVSILQDRSMTMRRHMELLRRSTDHLWITLDEARAAQQILLPKAETYLNEIDRALEDARRLEFVLKEANLVEDEVRVDVIELLWDDDQAFETMFTDEELDMSMREAKAKYVDVETFRKWKRARKKANKS